MTESRTLREDEQFRMRVIELTALPSEVLSRLTYNLLSDCLYRNIMLEYCMLAEAGTMHLFVLLRAGSDNGHNAERMFDDACDQIQAQLEDAGFSIQTANKTLTQLLVPACYTSGALFYAAEPKESYYVPANPARLLPIDWAEISRVLNRAEHAMFTVQFIPTALSSAEKRLIEDNLRFFEELQRNIKRDPDDYTIDRGFYNEVESTGIDVFRNLKQSIDECMFFVLVAVFGDVQTQRETATVMNRSLFNGLELPGSMIETLRNLSELPYQLAEILAERGHDRVGSLMPVMQRYSHLMKKDFAAAFGALPSKGSMIAGLKVNTFRRSTQPLPEEMRDARGVLVGKIDGRGQNVYLPYNWLPLHMVITGMPGTGKTTFAMGLMKQIYEAGHPFLIIEPTKTEYRSLIGCIPDLKIYTAGRSDISPLVINPFLPPKGITLEQYKPSLISIFTAAFSMTSPLDVIFPDVVNEAYTRYGWRDSSTRDSKGARHFGMQEFICVFRECVQRSNYDVESKMNLESGGVYRLQALLNANPVLFDSESSLDFAEMIDQPTLIEMDAIDNPGQKALIMSIIIVNLMLSIRARNLTNGEFKNAIMIDEAHLLLGQHLVAANEESAKSSQSAVQLLQNLVVTIRAYGTCLIFSDQSARKMTEEIVDNCNFKLLFHLENLEDRRMLAHAIGLSERMTEDVRQLSPGEAYIGCSNLPIPMRIHTLNYKKLLKMDEIISDERIRMHCQDITRGSLPFAACAKTGCCSGKCDYACREEANYLARTICIKVAEAMRDENGLRSVIESREELVRSAIESLSDKRFDMRRLEKCTMLQLFRRLRLTGVGSTEWIEALYEQ